MNCISIAIEKTKYEIPPEILREAFQSKRYDPIARKFTRDNTIGVSLESVIERLVVRARVITDINLSSGIETSIPLHGLTYQRIDNWNIVYTIPKSITGGRTITAVYEASYGEGNVNATNRLFPQNGSYLGEVARGIFMAESALPVISTANVSLINDNTVLISDANIVPGRMYLRCLVAHDPNLKTIKPSYYDVFSELVILATKAYVHNNLIIRLDEGEIEAGSALGRFREIVDGYADANQMYKDHLATKWKKASIMNDRDRYKRIQAMIVGGRH